MKTYLKIVSAFALGVGMTLNATVHAGALATAVLEVTGGVLINDEDGEALLLSVESISPEGIITGSSFSDISEASGNNTGDVSADLTSVDDTATGTFSESILGGGDTNLDQASQGTSPVAEDNYQGLTNPTDPFLAAPDPEVTAPVGGNFAIADQSLEGNLTDIDIDGDGVVDVAAGVDAKTRADVGLTTTDVGSSVSNTGADISLIFTVTADTTVTFQANFLANMEYWLNPDVIDPSSIEVAIAWSISIEEVDSGDFVLEYAPTEVNKTRSRSVGTAGNRGNYDFDGILSATSDMLTAGTQYQLTISHVTRADATKTLAVVSEPTTLALLGMSLLMLGATRRLRNSA